MLTTTYVKRLCKAGTHEQLCNNLALRISVPGRSASLQLLAMLLVSPWNCVHANKKQSGNASKYVECNTGKLVPY